MEIGLEDLGMELESSSGETARNTLGNGEKEKHMERESFSTQMEIIMKETGAIIKFVAMVFIFMKTEINMKENGEKMYSMVTERSDGLMALVIKVHIIKEPNME